MKISKETLKQALEIVKPGLANKEIIEQSTSFAFIDDKVVTYNDEICISHPVPDIGIKGVIKAEEMYNFLGKVKTEEITVTQEENEIVLKSGRAQVGFSISTTVKLPLEEEIKETSEWSKIPTNLLTAISFAIPCVSKDMTNPKISCIHLNKKGIVEATDSYRIIHWKLKKKLPFNSVLIPAVSLKEVVKLAPNMVAKGNGWLHFKNEAGTQISCRTFDETFVDTSPILKIIEKGIVFVFPDKMTEVLDRAVIFSKAQLKTSGEESISVSFDKKFLKVEAQSETAWFKERVAVKGKKEFSFSITPYLLKDILKQTQECTILDNLLKFEGEDWIYISSLRLKAE